MTCILFPGQGAQTPGFLSDLPDHDATRAVLTEASDVLGFDVKTLDSEEGLRSTINVQLSVLIAGTAATRMLLAHDVSIDAVAGLSLGSFTAAVAADAIDFADALRMVRVRATLMENAYPQGYGMAAIGGLRQNKLQSLADEASREDEPLYLANFNAPVEIVVTGSVAALDRLVEAAKKAGARRAQQLAVSVPSHCPLLNSVSEALSQEALKYDIRAPRLTYVGNRRARKLYDADAVIQELTSNVNHPVLWYDSTTLLYELGERVFFEAPPGDSLSGLLQGAFDDVNVRSMATTPMTTLAYIAARDQR